MDEAGCEYFKCKCQVEIGWIAINIMFGKHFSRGMIKYKTGIFGKED